MKKKRIFIKLIFILYHRKLNHNHSCNIITYINLAIYRLPIIITIIIIFLFVCVYEYL